MAKVVAHSYAQYYSNLRTSKSLGYSPKKTKKKQAKFAEGQDYWEIIARVWTQLLWNKDGGGFANTEWTN